MDEKLYCVILDAKNCTFYSSFIHKQIPSTAIEITKENHDAFLNGLNKNSQYIWQDKQGNLKLRDKFTKYNETTDTWDVDQSAIDNDTQQKIIGQAQIAYNQALTYGNAYLWNKLTPEQQQQLTAYLDQLQDIVHGVTPPPLPNLPTFIKG